MPDTFKANAEGLTSPAYNAFAVTPSDSTDLATTARALYVGTAGNLTVTMEGDNAGSVQFTNVPVGILPIRAQRVWATGTSASGIVALY